MSSVVGCRLSSEPVTSALDASLSVVVMLASGDQVMPSASSMTAPDCSLPLLQVESELSKIGQKRLKPLLLQAMVIAWSCICSHIKCALVVKVTGVYVGYDDVWQLGGFMPCSKNKRLSEQIDRDPAHI